MTQQLERETIEKHESIRETVKASRRTEIVKLLGGSTLAMSLILPVGIAPRLHQAQELEKTHSSIANQIPVVTVVPAKQAPADRELMLPGAIEAIVETAVFARTNGYVKERSADIGDRVKAGQLLARIETPEIDEQAVESRALVVANIAAKAQSEANRESAQAELDRVTAELSQAKANLVERESDQKLARTTYMRWKELGTQGAVSSQDVHERETRFKTTTAETEAAADRVRAAESAITATRAKLKAETATVALSGANIEAARAHAQRTTFEKSFQNVTSPFDGVITERNFDTGTLISSGSDTSKFALYHVARIDTVKVFADVPQYAATGIRVGQKVSVRLKEFPNRTFTGTIARTSVALDPNARTMRTEVHLPNSDLALVPGMYADVTFDVRRAGNALLIPANAVATGSAGSQVYVLGKDQKVHTRKIEISNDLGKDIETTSGLHDGELLVVNPSDAITDGTAVVTR